MNGRYDSHSQFSDSDDSSIGSIDRDNNENNKNKEKLDRKNNKSINTLTSALTDKVSSAIIQIYQQPHTQITFPHNDQLSQQLIWQQNSLTTGPSKFAKGGIGVFATRRLRKHERLGYYVGTIVHHWIPTYEKYVKDYNLIIQLPNLPSFEVDGTTFLDTPSGILARINEYIWYSSPDEGIQKNNCKLMFGKAAGQLITTKTIKAGEELTLCLGPEYMWTHYFRYLCSNAIIVLQHLSHHLGSNFTEELHHLQVQLNYSDLLRLDVVCYPDIYRLYSIITTTTLDDTGPMTRNLPVKFSDWLKAALKLKPVALCTRFRHAFKPGRLVPKWIRDRQVDRMASSFISPNSPILQIHSRDHNGLTKNRQINTDMNTSTPDSDHGAMTTVTISDLQQDGLSDHSNVNVTQSSVQSFAADSNPDLHHLSTENSINDNISSNLSHHASDSRRIILKPDGLDLELDYSHFFDNLSSTETDGPLIDSTISQRHRFRVCTFNINGLRGDKIPYLVWLISHYQIDILTLIDTKCKENTSNYFSKIFRAFLPDDTIIHSPTPAVHRDNQLISVHGGIMMILSPVCAAHMSAPIRDPLNLGVGLRVIIKDANISTGVIGMYWPPTGGPKSSNTLRERIQRELDSINSDLNPDQYLQTLADKWADNITLTRVIICADFNASWIPRQKRSQDIKFREWADAGAWENDDDLTSEPHHNTYYSGDFSSRIDHILSRNGQSTRISAISSNSQWSYVSDHRPLITQFSATWIDSLKRRPVPIWTKIKFDGKDEEIKSQYQDELNNILLSVPTLLEIIDGSVAIASSLTSTGLIQKRTRKFFDGWSPDFQYLQLRLNFVTKIQKIAKIWRHKPNSLTTWCTNRIDEYCLEWEQLTTIYQLTLFAEDDLYAAQTWKHRHLSQISYEFTKDILKHTKDQMHGAQRTQMRRKISSRTSKLEDERMSGKIGGMIRYLLGNKRAFPQKDSLISSGGAYLTSDSAIHYELTQEMNSFYSLDSEAPLASLGSDIDNWSRHDFDELLKRNLHPNLWYTSNTLWHGFTYMHQGGLNSKLAELTNKINQIQFPTFDEFSSAIDRQKKDSAPGVSRLTYPMIRAWPLLVRQRVYDDLTAHWHDGTFPPYWRIRYMCLIPKSTGDLRAANMRPIMLCEPLRKLWMKLILKPIFVIWDTHSYISSSQSGYRSGKSTAVASLPVTNNLEEGEEECCPVTVSSLDIEKAFDRVTYSMQELTYKRLGVPTKIIDWLLEVDSGGYTIVRTNWSMHHWNAGHQSKFVDISHANSLQVPTFTPQQGMGQGDIPSAPAWNGFLDTLARAFEHHNSIHPTFYTRSTASIIQTITSMFADDIIGVTSSLADLASHCDIFCAWAILVRAKVATAKLRTFHINFNYNVPNFSSNLNIYSSNPLSEPEHAVVNKAGVNSFKHLGFVHSIDNSGSHQLALSTTNVLRSVNAIKVRQWQSYISAGAVMDALTKVTRAQECYRGALSPWSLLQMKQLDVPIHKLIRRVTHNMNSFPTVLINLPTIYGGLGVPSIAHSVQLSKYSMAQRGFLAGSFESHTIQGLLLRQLRITHKPTRGFAYPLRHCHQNSWATSLIEYGREAKLTLWTGGIDPVLSTEEPISNYLPTENGVIQITPLWNKLVSLGLTLIGDLMTSSHWIDFQQLELHELQQFLPIYESITQHNLIKEGQNWILATTHNIVVEIVGFVAERVMVRLWKSHFSATARLTTILNCTYILDDNRFGAGTNTFMNEADFQGATRVIMSPDELHGHQLARSPLYYHPRPDSPTINLTVPLTTPGWLTTLRTQIRQLFSNDQNDYFLLNYDVYTDASWSYKYTSSSVVLHHSQFQTNNYGSLVFMSTSNWNLKPIAIVQVDLEQMSFESAFEIELLMIIVAGLLTSDNRIQIKSDCKSAVDLLNMPNKLHKRIHHNQFNLLLIGKQLRLQQRVSHVKAHAERRTANNAQWSRDDWGNYIADAAATLNYPDLQKLQPFMLHNDNIHIQKLEMSLIFPALNGLAPLSWRDCNNNISLVSMRNSHHSEQQYQYLLQRDQLNVRLITDTRPHWTSTMIRSYANSKIYTKVSLVTMAGLSRFAYDKHFHGRNRRHIDDSDELTACVLCSASDSRCHILLHCVHPSAVALRNEAIRDVTLHIEDTINTASVRKFGYDLAQLIFNDINGDYLWTSTWTPELLRKLQAKFGNQILNRTEYKLIAKLSVKIGRTLTDYGLQLINNSHQVFQASNIKYKAKDKPINVITVESPRFHPLVVPIDQPRIIDLFKSVVI